MNISGVLYFSVGYIRREVETIAAPIYSDSLFLINILLLNKYITYSTKKVQPLQGEQVLNI